MTKIEDMSEPERQAWITFLADGAVFLYFWQKMTIGLSPQPIHTNIDEFAAIVLRVVMLTVILHIVISLIFEARKRKEAYSKDERDIEIERRGAHWGYRLMEFGVGGVVITMFLHHLVGESYIPPLRIEKPVEIMFALLVVCYVADLVKHGVMLLAYRE